MTIREKMKMICGFDDLENHEAAYKAIVNELGFEKVHALLPADDDEIILKYKDDHYLNNIPLKKWDAAGGWSVWENRKLGTQECRVISGSPLPQLLAGIGIRAFSCSECVCILKTCARMVAEGNR